MPVRGVAAWCLAAHAGPWRRTVDRRVTERSEVHVFDGRVLVKPKTKYVQAACG